MPSLKQDLLQALRQAEIETRVDPPTRLLYSTDASIYQIEPLGVAFPQTLDQLNAIMELAAQHETPVIARGAGSGLAGQAIGEGLVVDCSRYLNDIRAIEPGENGQAYAVVEPGVVYDSLNRAAAVHGLQVGPDPASGSRATLGGCIANNASGSHSIVYGMFSDHLKSLDVVLSDGSTATLAEIPLSRAEQLAQGGGRLAQLYAAALKIRREQAEMIKARWPRTWRRAAGYNLNTLLPWSPSKPPHWQGDYPPVSPGTVNLAQLIAGSEGTLALIRQATVRLVPKPEVTILAVLAFDSNAQACDATPAILDAKPSAVELIPRVLLELASSVPAYARQLDFIPGGGNRLPGALLVVEFSGEDPERLLAQARQLSDEALIVETPEGQARVWKVRKAGLGILQSSPGDRRTQAFIEDLSVPVENLGDYVRGLERIAAEHSTETYFYAHASAGCLHTRPIVDLKSAGGAERMESIAAAATELVIAMGGSTSGEHGDGIARSQWLEHLYGPEILASFRGLKEAADPHGILNPGKIVDPLPMSENLRYGAGYQAHPWPSTLSFERQGGLDGAIELCNGSADCRKLEGVMCPSFQATGEEFYATRGRANLLRALISDGNINDEDVFQTLDLCLACKGCKSECPSAVDMAKLKYAFLERYYRSHRRKLRDYLFGYFHHFANLGSRLRPIVNLLMRNQTLWNLFARLFALAPQRMLPTFQERVAGTKNKVLKGRVLEPCLLLSDAFSEHFYPHRIEQAVDLLARAGYRAEILPVTGAGRTLISKGFLRAAKRHARKLLAAIDELDPAGEFPIIGIEPSEIYTLSDEYPDFFPADEGVTQLAKRAWMIDEFLIRDGRLEDCTPSPPATNLSSIILHGHCYQKARPPADDGDPVGVDASVALLEMLGYPVEVIDAGCCGIAGAFGYEAEHYDFSMQVGELALFPAVRSADADAIVAASGVSCQSQIEDGAGREAVHPITIVYDHLLGETYVPSTD